MLPSSLVKGSYNVLGLDGVVLSIHQGDVDVAKTEGVGDGVYHDLDN